MIERDFGMEDVLSFLTGILMRENLSDLLEIASFVLERKVSLKELPFIADEIRRRILKQHPWLRSLEEEDGECVEIAKWVRSVEAKYGGTILLKAEDFSKKSRFRRLRERAAKLLFKTERLGF